MTPEQRQLRARVAAHERWARTPESERTKTADAGQRGLLARFERQVDPDGVLSPAERIRRAESARRAHMARLALASSQARARRKAEQRR